MQPIHRLRHQKLLTDKDNVDLKQKLAYWESFYNLSRPHGALNGKAPYEALREKLQTNQGLSRQIVLIAPMMDGSIAC